MKEHKLSKIQGYIPFLFVAFLNAFTDLGHKILIQNTLTKSFEGEALVVGSAIVQGMILLPFVLSFSPAGFLSDKYPKDKIIQWASFAAIPIAIGITISYFAGAFEWAFALTFLLALQSALYSPAKYGYIKELVGSKNLAGANSAIQGLTIVAILGGTFVYTVLFENLLPKGNHTPGQTLYEVRWAGFLLIATCVLEWILAKRLPQITQTFQEKKFQLKPYLTFEYLRGNLGHAWSNVVIRQSIIGLSLFWAVNQVLISSFPAYLKELKGVDDTQLINGILAVAAIGIAAGSWFAAKVSKNYIEIGLIPIGVVGMAGCLFVLPLLSSNQAFGILFAVFGFFGGSFVVPLNSLIQFHSKENESGHILAANNFIQTVTMLVFLGGTILLSRLGFAIEFPFICLAFLTFIGAVWTLKTFPQSMIRWILKAMVNSRYKLNVLGLNDLPSEGGVLLLGNHVSWIDWAILQLACPRPIRFVMLRSIYEKWYLKWFLDLVGVIPINRGASKEALQKVHEALKNGEVVALFPEGHISKTGSLSKFRTGFERAAESTGCKIIPFYLQGLWGSVYSYASGKYRENTKSFGARWITVAFGKAMACDSKALEVKQAVQEISIEAWESHLMKLNTLPKMWVNSAKKIGTGPALYGHDGVHFSGTKLLGVTLAFANHLAKKLENQQNVGLLLPPSAGGVIGNFALWILGKTNVNLNYTSSPEILRGCVAKANIRTILTSRQFEKKLMAKGFGISGLSERAKILYLEDIKGEISKFTFVSRVLMAKFIPAFLINVLFVKSRKMEDTAAILFSSGSEGTPKGVELSHANLVGNIKQTSHVLNPEREDVILSSLPLFHAFGLTITTCMPLIEGIPVITQPDPTDGKTVGRLVAEHKATLLCGTSTFLRMYGQNTRLLPLHFKSLRLVVAGAEKLREDVRSDFKEKFGLEIYEGYGTTETTPVASFNQPDVLLDDLKTVQVGNKIGTVGLPLPGSRFRIVDPETYAELPTGEEGMVLIGGNQLMKGYYGDREKTESVIKRIDGKRWYVTGDKGRIDEDGFLKIVDRYSRFAKVGGEMVSLSLVEKTISEAKVVAGEFMAVAIPHSKKGEQICLLYTGEQSETALTLALNTIEMPNLYQPSSLLQVDEIPRLGSGKLDLKGAKTLALNLMEIG